MAAPESGRPVWRVGGLGANDRNELIRNDRRGLTPFSSCFDCRSARLTGLWWPLNQVSGQMEKGSADIPSQSHVRPDGAAGHRSAAERSRRRRAVLGLHAGELSILEPTL